MNNQIIVYKKTNCPWAAAVLAFLITRGFSFEVRDIMKNPEFKDEVEKETGQNKSPTLLIKGEWLPDASVEQVDEALKKAGFE